MKYIIARVTYGKIVQRVPIIFPSTLVHSIVAEAFKEVLIKHKVNTVKFVSAGDITIMADGVECSGSSETMKLTHHPDDSKTIALYDYLYGM